LGDASKEVYIGTSGYDYYWNKRRPSAFEWYLSQGFNSVEVNATFYRWPSPFMVNVWTHAPSHFRFSFKVHRSITHYSKLSKRATELWEKFSESLKPLHPKTVFWLYQMPPSFTYTPANMRRVNDYFSTLSHQGVAVVEFRSPEWWQHVKELAESGAAFCSVDAPGLPNNVVAINDTVYLRLHGRTEWYSYVYTPRELDQIVEALGATRAKIIGVYVNNDEGMLENGLYLARRLIYEHFK
jgi:uncharacterized protein YecE (DUF72 family)